MNAVGSGGLLANEAAAATGDFPEMMIGGIDGA